MKPTTSPFSCHPVAKLNRTSIGRQHRTGALTVEVALCLPILFLVLFGCFELAHANMLIHSTESAAYAGARAGITPGATDEKIAAAAEQVLRSVGIKHFNVIVTPKTIKLDTKEVKVEIEVPFKKNTFIPTMYLNDPKFRGQCTLTRETL